MDVDVPEPPTMTLVIRTPDQACGDLRAEDVRVSWTVRELKEHLSEVHPSRPVVSAQRLIYGGKLLPDHLQLKDLFKQVDITPTLHLVCAPGKQPQDLGARPKTKAPEQAQPSSSSSRMTELRQRRQTSSPSPPDQTHTPGNPPSPAAPATPGAPPMTPPSFPSYSLYSPQQLLWLQHLYARQYYMQYHAALAAARSDSSAPAPTVGQYPPVPAHHDPAHHVPVPGPLGNQNPINDLPVNQNPVQDGAFLNPAEANQNMRMNAQGGAVMEDEDDVEHDWLDWLYSASRVAVLLMIVYFNSNLSRFLLVMSTLLLLYLHTAGLFPFRRRANVQEPDHQRPPEVQQNQNQNPNQAEEPVDRQPAAPLGGAGGPTTPVLVPPHRVSFMWTAWVFFKSFFSSLIPEGPQGLAN